MQPETRFKNRVLGELKTLPNAWFFKTQERARRGVPDIILCLNGVFVALELKTDTGKLDKLQDITLKKIAAANGVSCSVSPATWPIVWEFLLGVSQAELGVVSIPRKPQSQLLQ